MFTAFAGYVTAFLSTNGFPAYTTCVGFLGIGAIGCHVRVCFTLYTAK